MHPRPMPQNALRGVIRWTFVDVFVNIWRESLTYPEKSVKVDFFHTPTKDLAWSARAASGQRGNKHLAMLWG